MNAAEQRGQVVRQLDQMTAYKLQKYSIRDLQYLHAKIILHKIDNVPQVTAAIFKEIKFRNKSTQKERKDHSLIYFAILFIFVALVSGSLYSLYQILKYPINKNGDKLPLPLISQVTGALIIGATVVSGVLFYFFGFKKRKLE